MTPERIKELRALCEAATLGPWEHHEGRVLDHLPGYVATSELNEYLMTYGRLSEENAAFIAAARTALPAALDRIEELEKQVRRWEDKEIHRAIAEGRVAISSDFEAMYYRLLYDCAGSLGVQANPDFDLCDRVGIALDDVKRGRALSAAPASEAESFRPPSHPNEEPHAKVMAKLRNMTAAELAQTVPASEAKSFAALPEMKWTLHPDEQSMSPSETAKCVSRECRACLGRGWVAAMSELFPDVEGSKRCRACDGTGKAAK